MYELISFTNRINREINLVRGTDNIDYITLKGGNVFKLYMESICNDTPPSSALIKESYPGIDTTEFDNLLLNFCTDYYKTEYLAMI